MAEFFSRVGSSSQKNPPNKIYAGTVKKVRADGMVRVKVPQLGMTTEYIKCLHAGPLDNYNEGDKVLCAFIDGRFDELFVLGRYSYRSDPSTPGGEPIGHTERTDSLISFNDASRTFTIEPVGASYSVWCVGTEYVKTGVESIEIPDVAGLYYVSFGPDGVLRYSTSFFVWDEDCPTAYIYWNGSTGLLFDERHGITLDWQTHEYLHRTRGAVIANGLQVSEYNNTNESIKVDDGTFFDEDLQVDIVHSLSPDPNTWEQQLQGPARIPVMYRSGSTWAIDPATDFPFKLGNTYPLYNIYDAGIWVTGELTPNDHAIMWIVATNMLESPVVSIMGQQVYSNIDDAREQTWETMDYEGLPLVEMRVLAKIIFLTNGTSANANIEIKEISDYRRAMADATSSASAVVSHSDLTDLSANDHPQYFLTSGGTITGSISVSGDITFNNNAIVSSNASTTNIDHVWHDDASTNGLSGTWHFVSDSSYKSIGNSMLEAGGARIPMRRSMTTTGSVTISDRTYAGSYIKMSSTSTRSITVQSRPAGTYKIGDQITVIRDGTGAVYFSAAAGSDNATTPSIRSRNGDIYIAYRYSAATLICDSTDGTVWYLIGDLT